MSGNGVRVTVGVRVRVGNSGMTPVAGMFHTTRAVAHCISPAQMSENGVRVRVGVEVGVGVSGNGVRVTVGVRVSNSGMTPVAGMFHTTRAVAHCISPARVSENGVRVGVGVEVGVGVSGNGVRVRVRVSENGEILE